MRKSSIFYTITFIFILAITSISLAFLWLMSYDKQNYTKELNTKYSIVSRATLFKMANLIDDSEYSMQVRNFNMPEVSDKDKKEEIIAGATIVEEINADIGSSAILFYKKSHYLRIRHLDSILLLKDAEYQPYRYDIIKFIFGLVALIILLTYLFIIRKIKPLRKIKRQINKFANGDLDIAKISTGNDEISEVGEAFYNAVMEIKKLNESRQLFLRNIMHELKTPITKGMITVEMIEQTKNRDRLISVFEKLEDLINEFAAVERATAGITLTDTSKCKISTLIEKAIEIAMIERKNVKVNIENDIEIYAEEKMFSVAIKNIIDNGMKYSANKKIEIVVDKNKIDFITPGKPMEQELSVYIEPFSKGKNAKNSFGLGLYIVDNILKSHNLTLSYRYENEKNIFSFENLEKITVKKEYE
ncbi:two-component system sensor histidine kinase [Campylobacter blaseri]|uniref:histidine kinase n=1 Tax=Campylobacter blaseri TaxID=2042961 RepID=A0A2P8QZM8_9BACT|nr:ArsS family sensor histidine kinase [Campylobacter blaseri]PSM51692.1 two-component sensor histidine kinase [Campylobacter blaseri]PSM53482.1 two-component sensor histidine kinase [Campylobacter blaseri]QKF86287.1 two-component system sensor histidine kinase [Campylobacter blaseri]